MPEIHVREMIESDAYFVSTCSHIHESAEIDACAAARRARFVELKKQGSLFKVALCGDKRIGFAYGIPIEHAPWGALGAHLMTIPCLAVLEEGSAKGAGGALIAAIERDAQAAGYSGVSVTAYRDMPGAEWFMPASFFEHMRYAPVDARGREVLFWKPFDDHAEPPHFLQPHYVFAAQEGVVIVDLFWNAFCQTSAIEAQRVREVCAEFGPSVLLREYPAEDREIFLRHQIPRAIYVEGNEISWGYEAPREGIRTAIQQQLSKRG